MLRHRIKPFLAAIALLSSGVALGQEIKGPVGPFKPSHVRYDLELFAPPDLSTYGNWPRPAEGFFFQYDRLYWAISQPERTDIGVDGGTGVGLFQSVNNFDPTIQDPSELLRTYENSLDTGFLRADQTWGNRFEFGFMEDNKGWFVSVLNLQDQDQQFAAGIPIDGTNRYSAAGILMVFNDPDDFLLGFVDGDGDGFDDDLNLNGAITPTNRVFGVYGRPMFVPPVNLDTNGDGVPDAFAGFTDFGDMVKIIPIFDTINISNVTSVNGVEISRSWRYAPSHRGSIWEGFFGVRWMIYRNAFNVLAFANPFQVDPVDGQTTLFRQGIPGTSFWNTNVDNNMFGPQIGFRWNHSAGRFTIGTELRFMAAVNFQSVHQNGEIGTGLEPLLPPVVDPNFPLPTDFLQNVPYYLTRTSFNNTAYDATFAPVGELRVNVNYKLTKAVSVQAGYNAILGGGISYAARRVEYTLPALKILDGNKNDSFFMNGLNLGVTVNR